MLDASPCGGASASGRPYADALIEELSSGGLIEPRDVAEWALSDTGKLALEATAGALLLMEVTQ